MAAQNWGCFIPGLLSRIFGPSREPLEERDPARARKLQLAKRCSDAADAYRPPPPIDLSPDVDVAIRSKAYSNAPDSEETKDEVARFGALIKGFSSNLPASKLSNGLKALTPRGNDDSKTEDGTNTPGSENIKSSEVEQVRLLIRSARVAKGRPSSIGSADTSKDPRSKGVKSQ